MDSFTRNYSIGFASLALGLVLYWLYSLWTPQVWELNGVLKGDPKMATYPYAFRVTDFSDGVATLATPRSFSFPVVRLLPILYPDLTNLPQEDPRMVAAQQRLVDAQKRAMRLVQEHPDVREVRWVLDVSWLADHGIQVQQADIGGALP